MDTVGAVDELQISHWDFEAIFVCVILSTLPLRIKHPPLLVVIDEGRTLHEDVVGIIRKLQGCTDWGSKRDSRERIVV